LNWWSSKLSSLLKRMSNNSILVKKVLVLDSNRLPFSNCYGKIHPSHRTFELSITKWYCKSQIISIFIWKWWRNGVICQIIKLLMFLNWFGRSSNIYQAGLRCHTDPHQPFLHWFTTVQGCEYHAKNSINLMTAGLIHTWGVLLWRRIEIFIPSIFLAKVLVLIIITKF
jgi:hypothetical protein